MKLKRVLLLLILFISVFFLGNARSDESIIAITSNKNAELNLKVTKLKSIEENMYIDREKKKIFYFFGNEGLVRNDEIKVTETLSPQEGSSKTLSRSTRSISKSRVSEDIKNEEKIMGNAFQGIIKNRVIVDYHNEPKKLYIEFYSRNKKIKKVVKNRYIPLKIEELNGYLNGEKNRLIVSFKKSNVDLEKMSSKMEIFSLSKSGESKNLKYTIENLKKSSDNLEGNLVIEVDSPADDVYIANFDFKLELQKIYLIKKDKSTNFNNTTENSEEYLGFFKWNSPIIDITSWERKKYKTVEVNTLYSTGEEIVVGDTIPYVDIELGEVVVPNSSATLDTVRLKTSANSNERGKVLLKNKIGKTIEARLYLKSDLSAEKTPVKGKNNLDIPESTSIVTIGNGQNRKVKVHLRIYDSKASENSLIVKGVMSYITSRYSDNTIELVSGSNVIYSNNKLPDVEVVDVRDSLKESIEFKKKTLDFSYDVGTQVGDDLNWVLSNTFVDVRLAELNITNFTDRLNRLKDPYIEINSTNENTNVVEFNGQTLTPYRYFIRLKNGKGAQEDKITEGDFILGYKKISTNIDYNSRVGDLKGDFIIRLRRNDYETIKNSGAKSLSFKEIRREKAQVKVVLNSDYSDRDVKLDLDNFNLITTKNEKIGKTVDLSVLLAMKEIKENKINLIFNHDYNSSGDIQIRGNNQDINSHLIRMGGMSVFDMSSRLPNQKYETTDIISFTSTADAVTTEETGATFEKDGYKSIRVVQNGTGIKFDLRVWNNSDRFEIFMDKSGYNTSTTGEIKGALQVSDINGTSKLKINLTLKSSDIENKDYIYSMGSNSTTRDARLIVPTNYTHSNEWNTEIVNATLGARSDGVSTDPMDLYIKHTIPTYSGDRVTLRPRKGVNEYGLSDKNFYIKRAKYHPQGTIENGELVLTDEGKGRGEIGGVLTRENVESIWRSNVHDYIQPQVYVYEITYGKGKRTIPQWIWLKSSKGFSAADTHKSEEIDLNDLTKRYNVGVSSKNIGSGSIRDENNDVFFNLASGQQSQSFDATKTKGFKGKQVRLAVDIYPISPNDISQQVYLRLKEFVLTKDENVFGTFHVFKNGNYEKIYNKLIMPPYNAKKEAYSSMSTLQPSFSKNESVLLTQNLEITRDKLEDATTTNTIVKNLGSVGLLGRDATRREIIKKNSTTLNYIRLPNRVVLKNSKSNLKTDGINGYLSFSSSNTTEIDFLQVEGQDQEKNIYLHIGKSAAEKLEPGVIYNILAEYEANRIDTNTIKGNTIAYIGLKTDNTSQLGLGEFLYDPLFQMNLQAEIKQDTSVKISLKGDRALIKSDGKKGLIRAYLTKALYSTDVVTDKYSTLTMRGLLNPYDYKNSEYGSSHELVVKLEGSTESTKISMNSSGGQGVLKTLAGEIYIGYSSDPDIKSGMEAQNSLEVLTLGIKEYKFKESNIPIILEYKSSKTGGIVASEKVNLHIPAINPKKWYYNMDDRFKLEKETLAVGKYLKNNKIIYPIGNVSLKNDVDLEITKTSDDSIGVRIDYDEDIVFTAKNKSSGEIKGKIVAIDESGSILDKNSISTTPKMLAIAIDATQSGYKAGIIYEYTSGSVEKIDSSLENKKIRIGRKDYWEGLIESIELKPISMGELVFTHDLNYSRGKNVEFGTDGTLVSGTGMTLKKKGDYIQNIPQNGKIKVYKWKEGEGANNEKLAEGYIVNGNLQAPVDIIYEKNLKTSYFMTLNKFSNNAIAFNLQYWDGDISNDKILIQVEDDRGITAMYRIELGESEDRSVLKIEYDNSLLTDGIIPDGSLDSLYFGSVLNPGSFYYGDTRNKIKSLNKLKVSYYGKDLGEYDTIAIIRAGQREVELENTEHPDNKFVIEDLSTYRIYKREIVDSEGRTVHEEGYNLEGYFNPIRNKNVMDGNYRGKVQLNIDINL